MRPCVIFNPAAKGEKAERFRRQLDAIGATCALKKTAAPGDARRLAAEAVREGFELIIAAGGDGTINEVLNGIGDAPDGFTRVCLGVLPLGTVNVFARELGIPLAVEKAWAVIRRGRETRIDLPCVEFSASGVQQRRHFAQLAGAGLDARAIERVSWSHKKRIGPLAYVVAGLKVLAGKLPQIGVSTGANRAEGELILIGNGRRYGGNYKIFPQADLRDGLLDVCVFPRAGWLTLARCGLSLLASGKVPAGVVQRLQAETFILSSESPAPFELDGELIGHLPATFSIECGRLRVLAPPQRCRVKRQ
ncbi:MAG: diacylglycerol kinase family lipid kinase [Verrucomicrobia bacterium]|nr:diacylglycerol kinase family lipid kinase [Verrucomicrobiota bacterium]